MGGSYSDCRFLQKHFSHVDLLFVEHVNAGRADDERSRVWNATLGEIQ